MIKQILDSKPAEHKSSGKWSISSIGTCKRKKYLQIKGLYKEYFDQKTLRIFSVGSLIHQQVIGELFQKCEQFDWNILSAELNIPPQKYFSGRIDILMGNSKTGEKVIIDVKSISPWSFNKIDKAEYEYIKNYKKQLQLYLHYFKIEKGIILFVNKSTSEVKELEVIYDKKLCLKLIKDIEDFFKNNIEKDIEPSHCQGGDFGCDCCGVGKENKK